jgi:hypothetical protein
MNGNTRVGRAPGNRSTRRNDPGKGRSWTR